MKLKHLSLILILSVLKNKEFISVFVCFVFHLIDMTDESEETVKISLSVISSFPVSCQLFLNP